MCHDLSLTVCDDCGRSWRVTNERENKRTPRKTHHEHTRNHGNTLRVPLARSGRRSDGGGGRASAQRGKIRSHQRGSGQRTRPTCGPVHRRRLCRSGERRLLCRTRPNSGHLPPAQRKPPNEPLAVRQTARRLTYESSGYGNNRVGSVGRGGQRISGKHCSTDTSGKCPVGPWLR